MAKKDDAFIVLTGLVIGAAAGTVAGILLAPASGKKTCNRLRENSERIREKFREQFSGIYDSFCCKNEIELVGNTNSNLKKTTSKPKKSPSKRKPTKDKGL